MKNLLQRLNVRFWLWLEARALAVLSKSWRHVTPAERHVKPRHSEAWRKAPVFVPRIRPIVLPRELMFAVGNRVHTVQVSLEDAAERGHGGGA